MKTFIGRREQDKEVILVKTQLVVARSHSLGHGKVREITSLMRTT